MLKAGLAAYAAAAVVFCALDAVWLGWVASGWYRDQFGSLLLDPPRWSAAIAFYAVFLVGLVLFGVLPAMKSGTWTDALRWGALYGFFTYWTYDLTNLATLRGFPAGVVVADVAWGVVLNTVAAGAGAWAAGKVAA